MAAKKKIRRGKRRPSQSTPSGSFASQKANLPKDSRSIPGIHSAKEAIRIRPKAIHSLWLKKGWENSSELTDIAHLAKAENIPIRETSPSELEQICPGHQGVCCHATEEPYVDFSQLGEREGRELLLVLDELEDPHNLGAILRTAWLMGVRAIILPKMRSVHLTPAVMKVASGGAEHVPVLIENNLQSSLKSLKDKGFWIYGLSHKASRDLWSLELPEKVIWVVGSEGRGLRTPVERECDELVCIPQIDGAASYNASVSAALALAETLRQWK